VSTLSLTISAREDVAPASIPEVRTTPIKSTDAPSSARELEFRQSPPSKSPSVLAVETCRALGLRPRPKRIGPELDLIAAFLKGRFFIPPPRCEMSVFQEPRLPSGLPDLVVAFWRRDVVLKWESARKNILTDDIRLVHYLYQIGPTSLLEVQNFVRRNVSRSLERLRLAGIVRTRRDKWLLRPLPEIFAVRRLIAVEAKISQWRTGLKQAWLNTWFASDSYVLVPRVPRGSGLLDHARHIGVGVCTVQGRVIAPNCRPRLPVSYASWLFNEWVGRIPTLADELGKRTRC
jgi:hypothetical protein